MSVIGFFVNHQPANANIHPENDLSPGSACRTIGGTDTRGSLHLPHCCVV